MQQAVTDQRENPTDERMPGIPGTPGTGTGSITERAERAARRAEEGLKASIRTARKANALGLHREAREMEELGNSFSDRLREA